ncbi:MAG: hypothetical protein O3C21_11745, partial [Verrucomicrobia bacterium]|nr:hypothetical protein [Verrucomicrobiota bacterium]
DSPGLARRLLSTRNFTVLAIAGAVNVGILLWMPIVSGGVRAGLLGSGALTAVAAAVALRHHPRILAFLATLTLLLGIAVLATRNRQVDTADMRKRITDELRDHLSGPLRLGR